MKRPRPKLQRNAPEGTVWFGGPIGWFSIALIVLATDLVPDEITRLLLVTPTRTQVKGVPVTQKAGARAATIGSWTVALTPHATTAPPPAPWAEEVRKPCSNARPSRRA